MSKELQRDNSRLVALDIAKTLSILGVLILHLFYLPERERIVPWMGYKEVVCFLMVNGFTYCLSLSAHGTDTIGKYYTKHLPRHLRSILWTFLVAFGFETYYHSILLLRLQPEWVWNVQSPDPGDAYHYYFRIRQMLATLKDGGIGPGAYYIPFLVILALAFPLFYYAYRRQRLVAVLVWYFVDRFGVPFLEPMTVTRLSYAFFGVLLYDFYRLMKDRAGKWGQLLWPAASVGVWGMGRLAEKGCLPFRIPHSEAFLVFGFLGMLLWVCQKLPPKNRLAALPFGAFRLIGGATYHIYLVQKVYCATRLPAYLVYFHEFNDYGQVGMALLLGLAFWLVDSRVTKWLFPRWDRLWNKIFSRKPDKNSELPGKNS